LARLKKNALQQLPISTPNLSALGKIDLTARKYKHVYLFANLEVKGRGEEQGERQGSQCKYTREKESIKVVRMILKNSGIPYAKWSSTS